MSIAPHPALEGLLMRGRLLGTVVLLALGVLAPSVQGAPGEKVQVCHRTTGNPTAVRIITVDASLVETHLAHGDTLVQQCSTMRSGWSEPRTCNQIRSGR